MVSIGLEQILAATCCVDVSLGCHVRSTQKSAQNREKNVGRRPYEKTTFELRARGADVRDASAGDCAGVHDLLHQWCCSQV